MATGPPLRRALLYVPASSARFLAKVRTLPALDTLIYDLEDSVPAAHKDAARAALGAILRGPAAHHGAAREVAVRVNPPGSAAGRADLAALLAPGVRLDALVLPKVAAPADLRTVADMVDAAADRAARGGAPPPRPRLLALIESARAVVDVNAICRAAPAHLDGLIFGAEDFLRDPGAARSPGLRECALARQAVVLAARAHGRASAADLVCTAFRGAPGRHRLAEECADGRGLGFDRKQVVHPDQVPVVQAAFAPGPAEVEWAVRVLVGNRRAEEQGRGAWTLEGTMVDAPVVGKAVGTVERAERCGVDLEGFRAKWRNMEPD